MNSTHLSTLVLLSLFSFGALRFGCRLTQATDYFPQQKDAKGMANSQKTWHLAVLICMACRTEQQKFSTASASASWVSVSGVSLSLRPLATKHCWRVDTVSTPCWVHSTTFGTTIGTCISTENSALLWRLDCETARLVTSHICKASERRWDIRDHTTRKNTEQTRHLNNLNKASLVSRTWSQDEPSTFF